jgi:hypothetical protein
MKIQAAFHAAQISQPQAQIFEALPSKTMPGKTPGQNP